jgi:CRISPR-associated protein Csm1
VSEFHDYFSEKYERLKPTLRPIEELLGESENYLLIAGDFFGIQKFIFEGLSSTNASKVLRAKSAYVQILVRLIAYRLCDILGIEHRYILSSVAGKFEILSPVDDEKSLREFRERLDDFFVDRFFGLSGIGLTWISCRAEDFRDSARYRALRDEMAKAVEATKYHKFSMRERNPVLSYDMSLDNASLCRICNMRKITRDERCSLCDDFVKLGERLTREDSIAFVREDASIEIFDGYGISFREDHPYAMDIFDISKRRSDYYRHWPLSSYVYKESSGIADFKVLAQKASKETSDGKRGIEALAVLKADVDDMGRFIRESDVTDSYENFTLFSQGLDAFFSEEVPRIMKENYPHTYTVFAGGDDLFLIGAWSEIVDLARDISDEFRSYVKERLTLSTGIILVKPSTPVSYLAQRSEVALEASKELDGKAAVTLFGETVKAVSYRKYGKKLYSALKSFETEVEALPTAMLYRLLAFTQMSKRLRSRDENDLSHIEDAMWKSKLSYTFRRNLYEKTKDERKKARIDELLKQCDYIIDNHPREAKMALSEFIYKRRKV